MYGRSEIKDVLRMFLQGEHSRSDIVGHAREGRNKIVLEELATSYERGRTWAYFGLVSHDIQVVAAHGRKDSRCDI
jgi:hypothetical protein